MIVRNFGCPAGVSARDLNQDFNVSGFQCFKVKRPTFQGALTNNGVPRQFGPGFIGDFLSTRITQTATLTSGLRVSLFSLVPRLPGVPPRTRKSASE